MQQILTDVTNELPSMSGHALVSLRRLVLNRDPAVVNNLQLVLDTFVRQLVSSADE